MATPTKSTMPRRSKWSKHGVKKSFFFVSMKFFVDFFPRKSFFQIFEWIIPFLWVPFNAPFDLSWGSRRLISFTCQKRCFMTTSRFRFFSAIFAGLGRLFPGWGRLSDGYSGFRIEYSRFRMSIPGLEWVFMTYKGYSGGIHLQVLWGRAFFSALLPRRGGIGSMDTLSKVWIPPE